MLWWDENIENIAEKETGAAGCGVNVNCPIKSSYAWQKYVVNAALRRPGNDAERHYFSFKFVLHPSHIAGLKKDIILVIRVIPRRGNAAVNFDNIQNSLKQLSTKLIKRIKSCFLLSVLQHFRKDIKIYKLKFISLSTSSLQSTNHPYST